MKRYSFIIINLLISSIYAAATVFEFENDGLIFDADKSARVLAIKGITDEKLAEARETHVLIFPSEVKYDNVLYRRITYIAPNFFDGRETDGIKKIIFPKEQRKLYIRTPNFCDMPDLEEIVHYGGLSVCSYCFNNLPKLKTCDFSESGIALWPQTFMNTGLERIALSEKIYFQISQITEEVYGWFGGLPNLVEIDFGDLSFIPDFIFRDMPKLQELTFNASLIFATRSSFTNLENLQKITFKQRDRGFIIDPYSFENTQTLTDIYVENEAPFDILFESDECGFYPPRYTLHVPVGSKVLYETAPGWCKFGQIVEDGAGVDETAADSTTWHCTAVSGGVAVVGAEGLDLRIFAIDGKLVERITPTADCTTVHLPAGLYIVSAAGRSLKVCVR